MFVFQENDCYDDRKPWSIQTNPFSTGNARSRRNMKRMRFCLFVYLLIGVCPVAAQSVPLDERPAAAGNWGYRPADGSVSPTDPPSFSWRPQKSLTWEIECASDARLL
jgi:hypothetical protein